MVQCDFLVVLLCFAAYAWFVQNPTMVYEVSTRPWFYHSHIRTTFVQINKWYSKLCGHLLIDLELVSGFHKEKRKILVQKHLCQVFVIVCNVKVFMIWNISCYVMHCALGDLCLSVTSVCPWPQYLVKSCVLSSLFVVG